MVEEILEVFPDAHISSGYARVRCPYHKEGNEKKASMSILLQAKGNCQAGFCHCFACGKVTDINTLFRDKGSTIQLDIEKPNLRTFNIVKLNLQPKTPKMSLPFRKSAYLESRGISAQTQEKFKIYEKDGKVHMPVFDRNGFYLYDNARSTTGKRFFVETGSKKSLWGVEEIDLSKPVAICESQIDAMSLWEVGIQAVATLGADNISALFPLKESTSYFILAFDPDEAGLRARKRAREFLGSFRSKYIDLPEGIDINQALQDIPTKEKFKQFIMRSVKDFVQ